MADAKERMLELLKAKEGPIYDLSTSEFWYPTEEQTKKFFEISSKKTGKYQITGTEMRLIEKIVRSRQFEKAIAAEDLTITDFGCGNGAKARRIIDLLPKKINSIVYFPVDISKYMIQGALELMKKCKGFNEIEIQTENFEDFCKKNRLEVDKNEILKYIIQNENDFNDIIMLFENIYSLKSHKLKSDEIKFLKTAVAFMKKKKEEFPKFRAALYQKLSNRVLYALYSFFVKELPESLPHKMNIDLLAESISLGITDNLEEILGSFKRFFKFLGERFDINYFYKKGKEKSLKMFPLQIQFYYTTTIIQIVNWVSRFFKGKNLIIFLGQTLGNFEEKERNELIRKIGENLNKGDLLLLGIEIMYDKQKIIDAYKDKKIENFVMATMKQVGFNESDVSYGVEFKGNLIQTFFKVKRDVVIGGKLFKEGDKIIVVTSYKFMEQEIIDLIEKNGFKIEFWPKNDEYALILCSKP